MGVMGDVRNDGLVKCGGCVARAVEISHLHTVIEMANKTLNKVRGELDDAPTMLRTIARLRAERDEARAAKYCDGCQHDPERHGHTYHEECSGCSRYYSDNYRADEVPE
jgi:hypothetical protein